MKSEPKIPAKAYAPEREARVATALRENLRKRKAQQESRATSSTPPSKD